MMRYTLITGSGKVMQFYLLPTAQCYQQLLGGVVIQPQIEQQECVDKVCA